MVAPKKYPDELRARAVRLWRESEPKPVIRRLAEQLNVHHEALRNGSGRTRPTGDSGMTGRPATCWRRTGDC